MRHMVRGIDDICQGPWVGHVPLMRLFGCSGGPAETCGNGRSEDGYCGGGRWAAAAAQANCCSHSQG